MVEPVALFQRARAPIGPPDAPRRIIGGGRTTGYTLADVARPLALSDFAIRTIIEKLRLLAEHDGMPLPRTPRFVDNRPIRGPRMIHANSRWDAGEFDAWLEGRHPGAPAAVNDRLRAELAGRAQMMATGR